MLGHASHWHSVPRRAEHNEASIELVGGIKNGLGNVATIGFTNQAAGAHPGRAHVGHDLVDRVPPVCAALLEHHRHDPPDRELANMEDHDVIRAVTRQINGHVDGAADMPRRLAGGEIDG